MLVLSRKKFESVVIDLRRWGLGIIDVANVEPRPDKSRLGFEADPVIPIHRREVFERIERQNGGGPDGTERAA